MKDLAYKVANDKIKRANRIRINRAKKYGKK